MPQRISYIGSGREYVHYSSYDLENLRSIDMVEFLGRKEGFTFRQAGTYYECIEHDSLVIYPDRRVWVWNSQDVKGRNALDWLQRVDGLDFQEACKLLMPLDNSEVTTFTKAKMPAAREPPVREKTPLYIPERTEGKYGNVFMYLTRTRCIDAEIVNSCFHERLIYQDTHANACFVGYDENNEIKCVTQRGTNTFLDKPFKGNTRGSDLRYCFKIPCDEADEKSEKNRLYIFEAPIDLLSHATIYKIVANKKGDNDPNSWKRQNRLSLSGVSDVALAEYLSKNPQITEIVCCLDNDEAGQNGARSIYEKYSGQYTVSVRHAKGDAKDYNEILCKYVTEQKQAQAYINNGIGSDTAAYTGTYYRR